MNKLLKFLTLFIFIIPVIVFAGGSNDDIAEEDLKKKIVCTYDDILVMNNSDGRYTLKLIMELWESKDGKLVLKRKPYFDGNYKDVGNSTHMHNFTLLKNGQHGDNLQQVGFQSMKAQTFKDQFEKLGHCPYILSNMSNASTYLTNISTTTSKAYHGMEGMMVSEGETLVQSYEGDEVVGETPVGPEITHECVYAIHEEFFTDPLYVKFYMKENGKKYWSAGFLESSLEGTNEDELTSTSGGILVLYDGGSGLIDGAYDAPENISISIDSKEIAKIFSQNSEQMQNNTFNCLNPSALGIVYEGSDVFYITTDSNEIKQDNATHFESLEIKLDLPNISLTPDSLDCVGILGRPDDNISKPPAFYLQTAFTVMKYVAIVILIVFTIMDYVSAVTAQDDDAIKKATSKLVTRLIICVVLFVLPTLIEFLFKILDIYGDAAHCKIN